MEETVKYTQGKWKVNYYKGEIHIPISVGVIIDNGIGWEYGEVICDILHGANDDQDYIKNWAEETEANAKLIASAPELLKIAIHLIDRDISSGDLRKKAIEVIKKATN